MDIFLRSPVLIAQNGYSGEGLLIDVDISGSSYDYQFSTGQTYHIPTSFTVGAGTATFQPGSVIKYGANAWLKITRPVSFPDSHQTPVFTSKDDNSFGDVFSGSSGTPSQAAAPALWFYYVLNNTITRNARIRWAATGMKFDNFSTDPVSHSVRDSFFEQCQTGVNGNVSASYPVSLTAVSRHAVSTPSTGNVTGTWTAAPYSTEKAFAGLKKLTTDDISLSVAPDPMGAVGPNHYIHVVNQLFAVYDKTTGQLAETQYPSTFFGATGNWVDPRVIYDSQANRWVICMLNSTSGAVKIGISKSTSGTLASTSWTTAQIFGGDANYSEDFPTLGADRNGVYVVVHLYQPNFTNPTAQRAQVIAIRKDNVTGSFITPLEIHNGASLAVDPPYLKTVWQPSLNLDTSIAATANAWVVAKDDPTANRQGAIRYGWVQWTQSGGQWTASFTQGQNTLSLPAGTYYDLDDITTGAGSASQLPYNDSNQNMINLGTQGSRFTMAMGRTVSTTQYIWTCHDVGVNSSGGATSANRSACHWMKLQVSGNSLSLADSGKIYDNRFVSPYFYYRPSLAVSPAGDLIIAFSGSRTTEYIGAFYTGKTSAGVIPTSPILVQAGKN